MVPVAFTAKVLVAGEDDFLLDEASGYGVVSVGPGGRLWRRNTVSSPFVHGDFEVSRVLEQGSVQMVVCVFADSITTLLTRAGALVAVMESSTFVLEVTFDGVPMQWTCQGADSTPGDGGDFDDQRLGNYQQLIAFRIPRNPIPLAGAL